ncbi:MAG TPA: Rrf2 family transcriptional regulator [Halothiobacillus sp.]|nr:MAG: Fe-S cluster assembly transcriptional regulator IscR [Halothiobacillus sp. 20-54-6]HQT43574.1 Rrf2 family transcriptional regulator [Halothiobacillus sp.]
MRLTTKGRYAVTAMLDLALHDHGEPTALADIADRQDLSLSYLEQLFAQLRRADLIKSVRGPGGGYQLARMSSEINVAQIVIAVDEEVDVARCAGKGNCQNGHKCLAHNLWMALSTQIREFLTGISLADLISNPELIGIALTQDRALHAAREREQDAGLRGAGLRHKN